MPSVLSGVHPTRPAISLHRTLSNLAVFRIETPNSDCGSHYLLLVEMRKLIYNILVVGVSDMILLQGQIGARLI